MRTAPHICRILKRWVFYIYLKSVENPIHFHVRVFLYSATVPRVAVMLVTPCNSINKFQTFNNEINLTAGATITPAGQTSVILNQHRLLTRQAKEDLDIVANRPVPTRLIPQNFFLSQ